MKTGSVSERRRFRRVLFDAPASIETKGARFNTRLMDISLNGVLIQRPTTWRNGIAGPFKINIHLDNGATICMQALIAHDQPGQLGFRCQDIDMESISHLRRLVELNLDDPDLLERELGALLREAG